MTIHLVEQLKKGRVYEENLLHLVKSLTRLNLISLITYENTEGLTHLRAHLHTHIDTHHIADLGNLDMIPEDLELTLRILPYASLHISVTNHLIIHRKENY